MRCFCLRPAVDRGLCRRHLHLGTRVRRLRVGDARRKLVIHQGLPGVVVRCPAPATVNALLTWDVEARHGA